MDSILTSIKLLLGIVEEDVHFDSIIIVHINSVLSVLHQLGFGPEAGFSIKDSSAVWNDFIIAPDIVEFVKSYIYLRVRLLFDPPTSSAIADAINRQANELEWRILVFSDIWKEGDDL